MVNINKIKGLSKEKGIRLNYICDKLNMKNSYLSDVARGKNSMSDERIRKIADILGTTYEYLTDQTEDPAMPNAAPQAPSGSFTEEQRKVLDRLMSLSDEEQDKAFKMLQLFMDK